MQSVCIEHDEADLEKQLKALRPEDAMTVDAVRHGLGDIVVKGHNAKPKRIRQHGFESSDDPTYVSLDDTRSRQCLTCLSNVNENLKI